MLPDGCVITFAVGDRWRCHRSHRPPSGAAQQARLAWTRMEQQRAQQVIEALRARNVFAHLKLPQAGITRYGIRVVLPDGREAVWANDGTAGLEAQIMRNGVLVGFVASIPGSENFGEQQIIDAIAGADYDAPI